MSVPAATPAATESMILCEGYDDRAFWTGLLLRLGCTDPGLAPGPRGRRAVPDPWGDRVRPGQYAFQSPYGHFIRVVPCMGADNILEAARGRLDALDTRDLLHLILNYDSDADFSDTAAGLSAAEARVDGLAREFGGTRSENVWMVQTTVIALACWQTQDSPLDGLPGQQTLERLVCAAAVAAYPSRGPSVQQWLDGRPDPFGTGPKHFAWSYYAGWYAYHGTGDYYRRIWEDQPVADELEARLRASGIWPVVEEMTK